jgi:AraC family of transcriptional regulator, multidrug resistance transcriptional activator
MLKDIIITLAHTKGKQILPRREQIIEDLTHWIDLNLHAVHSIEDVAARSGYSRWHIQHMFKQVNRVSILAYVRQRRLERAAKDLTEGQESISAIALRHGFGSQQAFSRAFIKWQKMKPSTFRSCAR